MRNDLTMFSAADAALLRPVPFENPERLGRQIAWASSMVSNEKCRDELGAC